MFAVVRALITGIGGFVGRHLTAHLLESGDEVVGLDLAEVSVAGVSDIRACDITDLGAVAAVFDELRPDVVYHLAGAASVGASFADPIGTWHINLDGTLAMLEAVRTATPKSRVVCVTSAEAYGLVATERLPVDELTPFRPHSPYGASKAAADLAARQYADGFDLAVMCARPFNHVGPGQDARFVVPSVAQQIAQGERSDANPIEVHVGNTSSRRDFLDVRDVTRAYRLIALHGRPGAAYVIARGYSTSVQELVETLTALASRPTIVVNDATRRRDGEQADLYGSAQRLAADTGWRAEIPLQTTLTDTLEWWRGRIALED